MHHVEAALGVHALPADAQVDLAIEVELVVAIADVAQDIRVRIAIAPQIDIPLW